MLTVANLQGEFHDIWNVNTDFEYHEDQRVRPAVPGARRGPLVSASAPAPTTAPLG
jgi:hypothetical protein